MPKLKIIKDIPELINELGSLPQFYGSVYITNDEDATRLTQKLEDNLLKDIISEIVANGFSINERRIVEEIESIHTTLYNLILLFKKHRKPITEIPDSEVDEYWVWTKTGNPNVDWQKVCISKNKLLNFRLCCIDFSKKHELSIEFND